MTDALPVDLRIIDRPPTLAGRLLVLGCDAAQQVQPSTAACACSMGMGFAGERTPTEHSQMWNHLTWAKPAYTCHARLVAAAAVLRWSTHAMVTLQLVGKVKAPLPTVATFAASLRLWPGCSQRHATPLFRPERVVCDGAQGCSASTTASPLAAGAGVAHSVRPMWMWRPV